MSEKPTYEMFQISYVKMIAPKNLRGGFYIYNGAMNFEKSIIPFVEITHYFYYISSVKKGQLSAFNWFPN